jgi:5-oxoprolinase (ATP-hydrolysing)
LVFHLNRHCISEQSFDFIDSRLNVLVQTAIDEMKAQGFTECDITTTPFLNLRYDGTDCALMCSPSPEVSQHCCHHGDFLLSFIDRYKREFGFTLSGRPVFVDDIRVRAEGHSKAQRPVDVKKTEQPAVPVTVVKCFFDNCYHETNVYMLESLGAKVSVTGPAILMETNSTILVEPGCCASITDSGDVEIEVGSLDQQEIGMQLDSIHLSIFSHRFMSIAEQMGRVLQRTAISVNIKERLDFSCALFGPDGGLVANAPHIPVHLGAMQEAVQWQMKHYGDNLRDGDIILTNHPAAGGSHLPDLTVITPVFIEGQPKPVFFVANRGHHADIGGTAPGSMPPHSKALWEEGMAVMSFKLVEGGRFQEEEITDLLMSPSQFPNSSGTRNLHDNLSDLRAQVAANTMGIALVDQLVQEYSLGVVQAYMQYIQENAEVAVREMLKEIAAKNERSGLSEAILEAKEYMDDGTPICLKITIDKQGGTAQFDFSGTGPEVKGNWNAPRAVVFSSMIYCLRCMVGHDVPLNQGCLAPTTAIIPTGSLLDPSDQAAVTGGNVLTSQRIVDVIFKAFSTCAASQGCMNNITFGDDSFAYYETVAGGAGAGPSWHGRSGIHTHMTNTRITDPEILEKRYPVILKQFSINKGSGGDGLFVGGDGVIREMIFRRLLTLCVLSERRAQYKPYGLHGGSPGQIGENWVIRRHGEKENLGGKNTAQLQPGDIFVLKSPGGGGYGNPATETPKKVRKVTGVHFETKGSVVDYNRLQQSA